MIKTAISIRQGGCYVRMCGTLWKHRQGAPNLVWVGWLVSNEEGAGRTPCCGEHCVEQERSRETTLHRDAVGKGPGGRGGDSSVILSLLEGSAVATDPLREVWTQSNSCTWLHAHACSFSCTLAVAGGLGGCADP